MTLIYIDALRRCINIWKQKAFRVMEGCTRLISSIIYLVNDTFHKNMKLVVKVTNSFHHQNNTLSRLLFQSTEKTAFEDFKVH